VSEDILPIYVVFLLRASSTAGTSFSQSGRLYQSVDLLEVFDETRLQRGVCEAAFPIFLSWGVHSDCPVDCLRIPRRIFETHIRSGGVTVELNTERPYERHDWVCGTSSIITMTMITSRH
jgi:hypothetical protein